MMHSPSFQIPRLRLSVSALLAALTVVPVFHAAAVQVRVTVENLSPTGGTLLTPVWVGFHDGTFDLYDRGGVASPALERLAEDGNTAPLSAAFAAGLSGRGRDDCEWRLSAVRSWSEGFWGIFH